MNCEGGPSVSWEEAAREGGGGARVETIRERLRLERFPHYSRNIREKRVQVRHPLFLHLLTKWSSGRSCWSSMRTSREGSARRLATQGRVARVGLGIPTRKKK